MNHSLSTLWRIARRDLSARIRGLRLLAVCLFLGVATLAAIGSLTAGIATELSERGRNILGGDIQIGIAQRTATPEELSNFRAQGKLSETVRLRAMAIAQESLLAELKAVDESYPLYGSFTLQNGKEANAPASKTIWIAPELADRLTLKKGSQLRFGEQSFTVEGIIAEEPDRLGEGFTIGPVAVINLADLQKTGLIQPGSMFEAKYRIKLPTEKSPDEISTLLQDQFPNAGWEIRDRSNGAPGTRRFVERMGQFLTLVGLAALVIAGIGVGNGVNSYLQGKRSSIATLKVTGADSGIIFRIYLMQILAISSFAILGGLLAGALLPNMLNGLIAELLPVPEGFRIYPLPLIASAIYGLMIAIAFAIPPLAQARIVPAAGLFRTPLKGQAIIDWRSSIWVIAAILTIIALALITAREPIFSLGFVAAAIAVLLLLFLIGIAVKKIAARLPRPEKPLPRLAIANLHRPGAQTGSLVVALGLGLTLFVTLAGIQTSINNEIQNTVPDRAPSFFALDVPKERAKEFTALIKNEAPDAQINMIPALRGNVTEFGGQRVEELENLPDGAWVLRGDRGVTYSDQIPEGSEITAGEFWNKNYRGPPQISLGEDVAASLGVGVGDTMSINILGVEVQGNITSLRRVNWNNFGLNYVIVFSPGSFDSAPHGMVATITAPKNSEANIARAVPPIFPSSSLIKVGEVVTQVTDLLTQMSRAIAAAASIAILAGIAVLIGAIAASRASRIYDSVIMKLLGATRRQILGAQILEYALLSILLGIVATILGLISAWFVITQIFDFTFAPDPIIVAITLVGGAGVTLFLGMVGSLPILRAKPAEALRQL